MPNPLTMPLLPWIAVSLEGLVQTFVHGPLLKFSLGGARSNIGA